MDVDRGRVLRSERFDYQSINFQLRILFLSHAVSFRIRARPLPRRPGQGRAPPDTLATRGSRVLRRLGSVSFLPRLFLEVADVEPLRVFVVRSHADDSPRHLCEPMSASQRSTQRARVVYVHAPVLPATTTHDVVLYRGADSCRR